jgi:hypothetical protein
VSLGSSLNNWKLPDVVACRPLQRGETRFRHPKTKRWCIHCEASGRVVEELPPAVHPLPLLLFDSDRAGSQWAAFHFMAESLGLVVLFKGDDDHDDWNQCKRALQWSRWYPWATVLLLTPALNLHSGPWQSGAFHVTLQDTLEAFVAEGIRTELWKEHEADIAADLEVGWCNSCFAEVENALAPCAFTFPHFNVNPSASCPALEVPCPQTEEQSEALLQAVVLELKGGSTKGDTLKMSRWFSWVSKFKSTQRVWTATLALLKFYHTKVLNKRLCDLPSPRGDINGSPAVVAKTIKEEIRALRGAGLNTLSLAIPLMAREHREAGRIISMVLEPVWFFGASRAKDISLRSLCNRTRRRSFLWPRANGLASIVARASTVPPRYVVSGEAFAGRQLGLRR